MNEHVEKQHWTSDFIEPAIVIPGLFIELQPKSWNTARRDPALESQTTPTRGKPCALH
ncbi:MAG: hypothetical protein WCB49_01100 [Gammaproteobacteria bacterium]